MKAKEIIKKALRKKSLRIIKPNDNLSSGHRKKANHNLIVMTDLQELGHEDWVVVTAYYSMYQSSLSLLTKIGLQSKEHVTTVSILEYFFDKVIGKDLIKHFDKLKNKKDKIEAITIQERYIDYLWKVKRARENVQYGVNINYKDTEQIVENAREFVNKIKIVINELDEKFIEAISDKIKKKLSDKKRYI